MAYIVCTSNLDLVSFLFVPALYSTLKLEIFPFTCLLTFCGQQCDSHVHIVLCCGAKMVLFTNKLSEHLCHIINPYLFTKFHTSKHLGKRVGQTCMFTLFFVVVRKQYCLPTSYQNVCVISLIPTCLQSFTHQSSYASSTRRRRKTWTKWENCYNFGQK